MDATLDYTNVRPQTRPLSERVNVRLIGFLLVIGALFGWVLWTILDQRVAVKQGDYYFVDLKAMGNFPFDALKDAEGAIPQAVRELNGKKVVFHGEMFAPGQASTGVREFQLVYSIQECCMGGPPKVQERVFAFVPAEKKLQNYTGRQVIVTGTLHVDVQRTNGEAVSVFRMDVDDVKARM